MSYLQRNKPKNVGWRKALMVIVFFLIILYILSLTRVPIVSLTNPFWKGGEMARTGLAGSFSLLRSKDDLLAENERLRAELASYGVERAGFGNWHIREAELLELLGRKMNAGEIAASVLAHPPQSPYDTLVIDVGSRDGVVPGQVVRLPEGPVLGQISEVYGAMSKVKLFSVSGERMTAVLERGNVSIELVGAGGGMFSFATPRDVAVELGDRILSADIRNRLVAVVGNVSMKPTDSFKEVSARSPGNIFGIRSVFVER